MKPFFCYQTRSKINLKTQNHFILGTTFHHTYTANSLFSGINQYYTGAVETKKEEEHSFWSLVKQTMWQSKMMMKNNNNSSKLVEQLAEQR